MQKVAELLTTGQPVSGPQAITDYYLAGIGASPESYVNDISQTLARADTPHFLKQREWRFKPILAEQRAAFTPPAGLSGAAAEAVRVMVEGAALPLYDAIKLETEAFMRLAGSDESKRLIAEFFASRKK
jgi:hypothetical protein